MRGRYDESLPLAASISTRISSAPAGTRHRYSLSARARRYAVTGLGLLALAVTANMMLSRSMSSTALPHAPAVLLQSDTVVDATQIAPAAAAAEIADAAVAAASAFPGSVDEIVDTIAKPKDYSARLYSGYLPLRNGGEAFYFLAESQSGDTPEHDPVLLWLNGGPGASSLAGCFTENGPLLVSDDGNSVRVNEHAWNQNAHLLCIESPVGVGFSYNASGAYVSDDVAQARDLYDGLQQFFTKFPHLRANDFIISGESYGGIYVPTTAREIVEGNARGEPAINLKKFVVGNGVNEFSGLSIILFAYYHGFVSTEEYQLVRSSCPHLREFEPSASFFDASVDPKCADASLGVIAKLVFNHINMYNVYSSCAGTTEESVRALLAALLTPQSGLPHPIGNPLTMCLNSTQLDVFFNRNDVRSAMHAKKEIDRWYGDALTTTSLKLSAPLLGINESKLANAPLLDYSATLKQQVTPIWKYLLAHGVDGVIYHGDADMVCDFIGGLWAVESLKLQRKGKRAAWQVELDGTQQTGGFVEEFKGLKYVTVKGAGHLVPMWKPIEAKRMLDLFVLEREG